MFLKNTSNNLLPHSIFRQTPLLGYALAMMIGIACAWGLRELVTTLFWLSITCFCALLTPLSYFLSNKKIEEKVFVILAYTCVALSAATLAQVSYEKVKTEWDKENHFYKVEILEVVKRTPIGIRADVKLIQATQEKNSKKVRLNIRGEKARELAVGDEVAFYGHIEKAWSAGNPGDFDYQSYLLCHGISGTAFLNEKAWILTKKEAYGGFRIRLLRFRDRLVNTYSQHFEGMQRSIISALTLGDKTMLDADTQQLFSDTGTSHILALSGLHLGIIFTLFDRALLRWIRYRRVKIAATILLVLSLWAFVFLAGSPLSLLRSVWMFTLLQLCACFRSNNGISFNNLCFAAIVILCVSPLSLFDASFQMSFSAVAGIIAAEKYFWQHFKLPQWKTFPLRPAIGEHIPFSCKSFLKKAGTYLFIKVYQIFCKGIVPFVTVSLSAQWATLPFIIYYFHNVTPYALVANFIVIPAAYLILGGAFLFSFFSFIPFLQQVIAFLLRGVLTIMTDGLEVISRWDGAHFTIYPTIPTLLLIIVVPCFIYAYVRNKYYRRRCLILLIGTLFVSVSILSEIYRLRPSRIAPQIAIYNIPQSTAIHFIVSAQRSFLYSSLSQIPTHERFKYIEKNYFKPNGMSFPIILEKEHLNQSDLQREADYFQFGGKKIFILQEKIQMPLKGSKPFSIDILVISKGCSDSLRTVRQVFRPQQIVLTGSLPSYYCERWTNECLKERMPCHNVQTDGAFILKL